MAAVTAVFIPAGPPSDDEPLFLLANDPYVLGYPCLPWTPHPTAGGVPARASLPNFVAMRVFLLRNSIGADAASTNAATTRSSITILFNAAAWSRWFTELAASGLLNSAPFLRVRDSDAAFAALTIANPASLAILAADYTRCEPFDVPGAAAVPAIPGRGRGRARRAVAAVPAGLPLPGPQELGFLNVASLHRLQILDPISPLLSFCRLVGAMGPCSTHAVRRDVASPLRIAAMVLRSRLAKIAGLDSAAPTDAATDALLADDLAGALHSAYEALSPALAVANVTGLGLRNEMRDAFTFLHGTDTERDSVITRRLTFVDDRPARLYSARICRRLRGKKQAQASIRVGWPLPSGAIALALVRLYSLVLRMRGSLATA